MVRPSRFLFSPRWRGALLAASVGASAGLASMGALAQAITIPANSNLVAVGGAAPAAGAQWNLGGTGIYMPSDVTLPGGGAGLTIAEGGGDTITLNGGGTYGRFTGATGPYVLTLSGAITLTGGSQGASPGGAIYIGGSALTNSTLTINSGDMTLVSNSATSGGAISAGTATDLYIAGSSVTLSQNTATVGTGGASASGGQTQITGGAITLTDNTAQTSGGAVDTLTGNITIGNASTNSVTITGNKSNTNVGGALHASTNSSTVPPYSQGVVAITGQTVNISGNNAIGATVGTGGAIWSQHQPPGVGVTIDGNSITLDDNHSAAAASSGGAIFARADVNIGNDASTVALTNNSAGYSGGAIASYYPNTVTIKGGSITISGNSLTSADSAGGALLVEDHIVIGGSASVVRVANNTAGAGGYGGALYASSETDAGSITIHGSDIALTGNGAGYGGAIAADGPAGAGSVIVGDSGSTVKLNGNTANGGYGGAIYADSGTGTGNVTLSGSNIELTGSTGALFGGAILAGSGGSSSSVTIGGSASTVKLSGNSVGASGGVVYTAGSTVIAGSSITLTGNSASSGGVFFAIGPITLSGGPADISGNTVGTTAGGGAMYTGGNLTINATSGDFTFNGNKGGGVANAIALGNVAGTATASLNAASGRAITFYDPIASDPTSGLLTVTAPGPGAVVFDGANYTNPDDLWSGIYGTTTVQGGTFTVRHGAIYGLLAADAGESALTSFTVASGATLIGGDAGTVRADHFTLAGTLDIAGAGSSASTFTIDSGNVSLGGSVRVKTYAGGQADVLAIDLGGGALTNHVTLNINSSGLGDPTSGNGILVVHVTDAAGALAADTFSGSSLTKGAYAYDLVQVGNDWYLQSRLLPVASSGSAAAIPTLGEAALALLALLLAAGAVAGLRRRG